MGSRFWFILRSGQPTGTFPVMSKCSSLFNFRGLRSICGVLKEKKKFVMGQTGIMSLQQRLYNLVQPSCAPVSVRTRRSFLMFHLFGEVRCTEEICVINFLADLVLFPKYSVD